MIESNEYKTPLLSVIVITFNHVGYIRKCIDSIISQQTDFEFEILIGEDDSNDGTRQVCIELAEEYPNLIRLFLRSRDNVIYIDNRPSGRFNFIETLKQAHGKYIALCDGDDYWIDNLKLQKQFDFLEQNSDVVLVGTNAYVTKDGANNRTVRYNSIPFKSFENEHFFRYRAILMTSTVMFVNKNTWDFPEWSKHSGGGDWNMFIYLTLNGGKAYLMDDYISVVHRVHAGGVYSGTSGYYKSFKKLEHYKVLKHHFEKYRYLINSRIAVFQLKCLWLSIKGKMPKQIVTHTFGFIFYFFWFRIRNIKEMDLFSRGQGFN